MECVCGAKLMQKFGFSLNCGGATPVSTLQVEIRVLGYLGVSSLSQSVPAYGLGRWVWGANNLSSSSSSKCGMPSLESIFFPLSVHYNMCGYVF